VTIRTAVVQTPTRGLERDKQGTSPGLSEPVGVKIGTEDFNGEFRYGMWDPASHKVIHLTALYRETRR
jgi:hypothetical protein